LVRDHDRPARWETTRYGAATVFRASARFYDAIYAFKDYQSEADEIDTRVRRACPGASTLLDVACGTGGHLRYLRERYACEGVDLAEEQLAIARERLPGVPLHLADMTSFDLGRRFDAVVCLFSSIGYARTIERLQAAVAAMSGHLSPGGVLIVEPWLEPDAWQHGHLSFLAVDEEDIKIARMARSETHGRLAVMAFEHLVLTHEHGVEHFVERHELGLFTVAEHLEAFAAAGLDAEHDPEGLIGRGLYTAVRA
jgi:SAM-dependent methyltransferase